MIFSAAHARMVLEGRKSQTRRRVRPGETVCRWVPGRSYAVQHDRCRPAAGRLVVMSVAQQTLADLTLRDARAEGFRTRREFRDHWHALFPDMTPADRVWVLVIRPDGDPVRLLHKDSSRGYTTRLEEALPDEPEAVPADVLEAFAKDGAARSRAFRERLRLEDRLAHASRRARAAGVDITREHAAIARRVEAIERKTPPGAVPSAAPSTIRDEPALAARISGE